MTSHNPAAVNVYPSTWKLFRLGELGAFTKGAGITKHDLIEDGIPCIRYGEIYTSHNFIIKEFYSFISHEVAESSKQIFAGDILFAGSGETAEEIGKCVAYVGHEKAYAGGDIIILRLKRGDPEYLGYLLNHEIAKRQIYRMGQGHSVVHIYASHLQDVVVPLPPVPEQRKIAEILSVWDEAITDTERLIVTLQQRKKGLMQLLLTGQVRFAEFEKSKETQPTKFGEIPADWGYVPIAKVAQQTSEKNNKGDDLPVLSCTKHNGLVDSLTYFGRQIFSEDTSTYKIVKRGQFAYATNHIEEGSIGYQDLYERALISPMYTVFETTGKIDNRYLYLVLKTETYRQIFEQRTSASVNRRGSLRWKEFSRIEIPLPKIEEQRRIANLADSCDHELALHIRKLEALKRQKRGLMQQLLTGRIRVKVD